MQLSADKAKAVVRAFRALPVSCPGRWTPTASPWPVGSPSCDSTAGATTQPGAIWAAVRDRGAARLLTGAVHAALADPELDAGAAVDAADEVHAEANTARAAALLPTGNTEAGETLCEDLVETAVDAIGDLLMALRRGGDLEGFAAGTLRLQLRELAVFLEPRGVAQ